MGKLNEIEDILSQHGVTPTSVRILVYKTLDKALLPMSLSDIEESLDTVDKSTISRTLNTFKNKGLLHYFNDGSGSSKYEICRSVHHSGKDDRHVHFRCVKCGLTTCLSEVRIPEVSLPENYLVNDINYMITGVCARCNARK